MGAVRTPWSSASFLHYAGVLIVLVATVSLLNYLSDQYGNFAFVAWSALVLFVVTALAGGYEATGMRVVAGLFSVVTLAAFVIFIAAIFVWIHLLGADDTPIGGFHIGLLLLYLVTFVGALALIARYQFPLLIIAVAASVWLFVVDLISNGGTWSAIVSIFVGFLLMLVGAGIDRTYGFWMHVAAGLAVGGAFLYLWHSSWWEWVLITIVALFFLLFAAALDRSSYAVLAALGLFLVATHFINDWAGGFSVPLFSEDGSSVDHPWAWALLYALFGMILVAFGFWFDRRRPVPLDDAN